MNAGELKRLLQLVPDNQLVSIHLPDIDGNRREIIGVHWMPGVSYAEIQGADSAESKRLYEENTRF
jgi:hypothetical protein